MTRAATLRLGDWVQFDEAEHQVLALAGMSVRLRSTAGLDQVVLASHLFTSPGFAVTGAEDPVQIEPLGLLDGLPEDVLAAVREWERHVVEVETGLPHGTDPDTVPRDGFDPQFTTVGQRDAAKAAELGVSVRTVQGRRARYAEQGLWRLVDQRTARDWSATGRVDARVVEATRAVLDAETDQSTGTRSRLIRRVGKYVEEVHGPGAVPMPGRSTFYKLIDALATGRHSFGSAMTRRQTANRPAGVFTPSFAARPGEQVQIDSTPIDVLVLLDNGMVARADLTIAVDVATRTVCAAVLRPVGTKAVDAALLLARMLVPEPMRPGWSQALRMSASMLLITETAWRAAAAGSAEQQQRFFLAMAQRLGHDGPYLPPEGGDAIAHWVKYDSWRPTSRPHTMFPQTRAHRATKTTPLNIASIERQERSAVWFLVKRRGGGTMLHHRHLSPVLVRDWSRPMDGIKATIWESRSTFHPAEREPVDAYSPSMSS